MSADKFNPYRHWLGIESPQVNLFTILDLPTDAADLDTIKHAAARQLTRIRSAKPGPLAPEWMLVIDQIKKAESTLCDDKSRCAYLESGTPNLPSPVSYSNESISVVSAQETESPSNDDSHAIGNTIPRAVPVSLMDSTPPLAKVVAAKPPPIESQRESEPIESKMQGDFAISSKRKTINPKTSLIFLIAGFLFVSVLVGGFALIQGDKFQSLIGKNETTDGRTKKPPADSKTKYSNKSPSQDSNDPRGALDKSAANANSRPEFEDQSKEIRKDGKTTKTKVDSNEKKNQPPIANTNGASKKTEPKEQPGKISAASLPPSIRGQTRFHFYCVVRSLYDRRLDLANQSLVQLQKMDLNEAEKPIVARLVTLHETINSFWQTVEIQADRIGGGSEINLPERESPIMIVESSRAKVVFRDAGQNQRYAAIELPPLIAEEFVRRQLGQTATDYQIQTGAFRALHWFEKSENVTFGRQRLEQVELASEATAIIELFKNDWSKIINFNTKMKVDQGKQEELATFIRKEIATEFSGIIDQSYIDKTLGTADAQLRFARFKAAAEKLAQSGKAFAFVVLEYLNLEFDMDAEQEFSSLCTKFNFRKASAADTRLFCKRIISYSDREKNRRKQVEMLRLAGRAAQAKKLVNQLRQIENRLKK